MSETFAEAHDWMKVYDASYDTPTPPKYDLPDGVETMHTCTECGEWKTERKE